MLRNRALGLPFLASYQGTMALACSQGPDLPSMSCHPSLISTTVTLPLVSGDKALSQATLPHLRHEKDPYNNFLSHKKDQVASSGKTLENFRCIRKYHQEN